MQSLYSHANNTRLLHTSQQDVSERVHLSLQVLWPAGLLPLSHRCSSAISASHLAQRAPDERAREREEKIVCSFLHYFLLTVGGIIVSPSSAVSQISASTLVWEPWKQSSARSDEQFKQRRFSLLRCVIFGLSSREIKLDTWKFKWCCTVFSLIQEWQYSVEMMNNYSSGP